LEPGRVDGPADTHRRSHRTADRCAVGYGVLGDTFSIKVYQALAAALELNPGRGVVVSDNGNFPTDLYIAGGLIRSLDRGHELRLYDSEEIAGALSEEVAVLMLTEVDYKAGRLHDMRELTERAHELGILTLRDLAHSAGALPVDLAGSGADFAVGCTYKYLNSGPGGPAFIYVAPHLADRVRPALSGWLGHEQPFAFDLDYRPSAGIERMRVGTPPVIQMAALDIWDEVDMNDLRKRSIGLSVAAVAVEQTTAVDRRTSAIWAPRQKREFCIAIEACSFRTSPIVKPVHSQLF
jgi:kynureninase